MPHLNALLFHDRRALAGDVLANRFPNVLLADAKLNAGAVLEVLRSTVRADAFSMPTTSRGVVTSGATDHRNTNVRMMNENSERRWFKSL
jgi:hypothetical protein